MVILPAAFGGGAARCCFCVRRFADRHDGFRPNVRPGYVTVFRDYFQVRIPLSVGIDADYGTRRFHGLEPLIGFVHIISVARLSAQSESDDAGVVAGAVVHVPHAFEVFVRKTRIVARGAACGAVVALFRSVDIGLIDHEEAQFVAQIVEPVGLRRIGPDGVDPFFLSASSSLRVAAASAAALYLSETIVTGLSKRVIFPSFISVFPNPTLRGCTP